MIDEVNLVAGKTLPWPERPVHDPSIFEDLDVWVAEDFEESKLPDDYDKSWLDEMMCFLDDALSSLPQEFSRFVWEDPLKYNIDVDNPNFQFPIVWGGTVRAAHRYRRTYWLARQMDHLVDLGMRTANVIADHERLSNAQRQFLGSKLEELPESLSFEISDQGVLKIEQSGVLRELNGKDLGRVRQCKKCAKIFWARRSDQKCCSPRCNNTYNALKCIEKRKKDPDHGWKQDIKRRANSRARAELAALGYTQNEIQAYQTKFRKAPNRVIADFIVKACLENDRLSPEKIPIRKTASPLRDFLAEAKPYKDDV